MKLQEFYLKATLNGSTRINLLITGHLFLIKDMPPEKYNVIQRYVLRFSNNPAKKGAILYFNEELLLISNRFQPRKLKQALITRGHDSLIH